MPLARSVVQINWNGAAPADATVNTVYHTIGDGLFDPAVGWQNHANQVRDAFAGAAGGSSSTFNQYKNRKITVLVYDMADAKPRPEKASSVYTPSGPSYEAQDHEGFPQIAACMSYYVGRNLRGLRGRLYIGPFGTAVSTAYWQPNVRMVGTLQAQLLALGHGLFDVGGENVAWVLYSEKNHAAVGAITDIWADDSWDVIRRRKVKASARLTLHP